MNKGDVTCPSLTKSPRRIGLGISCPTRFCQYQRPYTKLLPGYPLHQVSRNLVGLAVRVERAADSLHTTKMSSDETTIPTEILYDILHLLCDGPIALHDLKNESYFHEFPWAVGQVCRHWRGGISVLHAFVDLFYPKARRATIYLERSGQHPLTIVVSMPCSGTEKFPKTVWGILLSCLKRWKKADLVLGKGAARDELLRCRGYMSSLESLKMSNPMTWP